jgi:hypothetical protein
VVVIGSGVGGVGPRRAGCQVIAAGTLGTQRLLHRMRSDGTLPRISRRLGELTRTNSEALAGAEVKLRPRKRRDFTKGVAITSSFHPDEFTHIEPVALHTPFVPPGAPAALRLAVAKAYGGPPALKSRVRSPSSEPKRATAAGAPVVAWLQSRRRRLPDPEHLSNSATGG